MNPGVANMFVDYYYRTFDSNRAGLVELYWEGSMLSYEGETFTGATAIVNKLTSLPSDKCVHHLLTLECHPDGPTGGMLIFVSGSLQAGEGEHHKMFSRMFQLMPVGSEKFYVQNDMFRLIPPPPRRKLTPSSPLPAPGRRVPAATTPMASSATFSVPNRQAMDRKPPLPPVAPPPLPSSTLATASQQKRGRQVMDGEVPCRPPTTPPVGDSGLLSPELSDQIRALADSLKAVNVRPLRTTTEPANNSLTTDLMNLLNTGSLEDLKKLKGIKEKRAALIIKNRVSCAFEKIADLRLYLTDKEVCEMYMF